MKKYLFNDDNIKVMATLPDESIDVICIDPPYLYLKKQKLERVFDEPKFFAECKRLLTKNGFIVMFGRGTSFYRWNTILDVLGFTFKEEIIWDKLRNTSPCHSLSRKHETIAIYSKGKGAINCVRVPFLEMNEHNPKKILETINRIKTTFGNRETFKQLEEYYKSGNVIRSKATEGFGHTRSKDSLVSVNRTVQFAKTLEEGHIEQSIIQCSSDHFNRIHPTQKPVRLLVRLLELVIPLKKKKIVIADWFAGSFSCGEATIELQKKYQEIEFECILTEIDEEYFNDGKTRIEKLTNQTKLF